MINLRDLKDVEERLEVKQESNPCHTSCNVLMSTSHPLQCVRACIVVITKPWPLRAIQNIILMRPLKQA